jgi:opacity protein-like surface antigen
MRIKVTNQGANMNNIRFIAILICAVLPIGTASAEDRRSYIGVDYAFGTYSEFLAPDFSPSNIRLRAGRYITDSVAIEGHYLLAGTPHTQVYSGNSISVTTDSVIAAYARWDAPISKGARIYGSLGIANTRMKALNNTTSATSATNKTGLSYVFGMDFRINRKADFNVDYALYQVDTWTSLRAISAGLTYEF